MHDPTAFLASLRADLLAQREFVSTRAPVYARILELLVASLDAGALDPVVAAWRGRRFGAWYERPLLLLAALRDDALREGKAHPLHHAIVGREPTLKAATLQALEEALAPEREHLYRTLAHRQLQTNEPSRAVAWLWPARLSAEREPERPVHLVDIGASAGLNLVADRLAARWHRPDGSPLFTGELPPIAGRTGYDLNPLDVRSEDDARWLRACVWPGQDDRQDALEAALAAFCSLPPEQAPQLRAARAGDVPEQLPRVGRAEARILAYQTVMRDYLTAAERERYEAGMRRWLSERDPGAALWIELEMRAEAPEGAPPSAITAHANTGAGSVQSFTVAHCDPHPRVIHADEANVAALRDALAPGERPGGP